MPSTDGEKERSADPDPFSAPDSSTVSSSSLERFFGAEDVVGEGDRVDGVDGGVLHEVAAGRRGV